MLNDSQLRPTKKPHFMAASSIQGHRKQGPSVSACEDFLRPEPYHDLWGSYSITTTGSYCHSSKNMFLRH